MKRRASKPGPGAERSPTSLARENARLRRELRARDAALAVRDRELQESVAQQVATGDILRILSSAPAEFQAVLDTIAERATRLCGASDAIIQLVEGDQLRSAAHHGPLPARVGLIRSITRETAAGRAVRDRRTLHVEDMAAATQEFPVGSALARESGHGTILTVPLLCAGTAIGVVLLRRTEVRLFSPRQVRLLETFADQAVIAIENARLFTELQEKNRALTRAHGQVTEALEQQTATGEILRTIAHTRQDVQPVFDTIVRNAARLCQAANAAVFLSDGRTLYHPANHGGSSEALASARARYPRPLDRDSLAGMAILERSVVHTPDIEALPAGAPAQQIGRLLGFRGVAVVPMLREGEAVGAILVARPEPGRFSEGEVELLKTFADQAVIAIENARLFNELRARTAELSRSVERLTALEEVGRAVSGSLDLGTVLQTIVSRATQLAGVDAGVIYEFDEGREVLELRATANLEPRIVDQLRTTPIRKGEGASGRAAVTLEPVQLADVTATGEGTAVRDALLAAGYRALLAVPLSREGRVLGALTVIRKRPGAFAADVLDLLRAFATQSALAIQNAQLFEEIRDKGRQLEEASRHKSQFLASMSHELRTPMNAILGYTEMIVDGIYGDVPERLREVMERIDRSGRHLLALINDVLDMSKIEAGQLVLSPTEYLLSDVVQAVVGAVEALAAEKSLALVADVAGDLPLGHGDERRLRQVLLNLVGNALKFTEAGEVRVTAGVAGAMFEVSVSDTGPGIAPQDQGRIFEEFQQADTSTSTRRHGGTGLGLAIARRIVELHGGTMGVESAVGRGSRFWFSVPVRAGATSPAPAAETRGQAP